MQIPSFREKLEVFSFAFNFLKYFKLWKQIPLPSTDSLFSQIDCICSICKTNIMSFQCFRGWQDKYKILTFFLLHPMAEIDLHCHELSVVVVIFMSLSFSVRTLHLSQMNFCHETIRLTKLYSFKYWLSLLNEDTTIVIWCITHSNYNIRWENKAHAFNNRE